MAGAILLGVPATTLDTDLWVDLPPRQYMWLINFSLRFGARHVSNRVIELQDGTLVNFVYEPGGLRSFNTEYRAARWLRWNGVRVKVLPLERIMASKRAIRRDKDILHLKLIGDFLRCRQQAAKPGAGRRSRKPAATAPVKARPAARRPARRR